ncbi:MAG: hypothetical protein KatS3mg032_1852 [Cyclobacteriaceae bacterium]|nr:MAG: hypothetical protein KatS3mg032_1852 [Cyclobacteriaceae bacterium]
MAENLRTTRYNDGTPITLITDNISWGDITAGAYSNHFNTENIDTIATYGRLYNWYAVNTGKLCPLGWHVPDINEWSALADAFGGAGEAGGALKEVGTTHWASPNTGATNESGLYCHSGRLPRY